MIKYPETIPITMVTPQTIKTIRKQFEESRQDATFPEFILITKIEKKNWQNNPASIFSRADNRGFKYDIFEADHPANLKNNPNPRDLNVLSYTLSSSGYEVYAYARRGEYRRLAALGAVCREANEDD